MTGPLDHCIGEIIFQNNFVLAEKIKVKVYVNEGKSLSTYKDTTRLWFFFVFSSWIINEFLKAIYSVRVYSFFQAEFFGGIFVFLLQVFAEFFNI